MKWNSQWAGQSLEACCCRPSPLFSRSVVSDSLRYHGLEPARLLCPRGFPGKNPGAGCHVLRQGSQARDGSHISCTGGWIPYRRVTREEGTPSTTDRPPIRAATPPAAGSTSRSPGDPREAWAETAEQQQVLPGVAALSTPWHLRHEVCFWVPQVGRRKTATRYRHLPPQDAREGNQGFKVTSKSLPSIIQH